MNSWFRFLFFLTSRTGYMSTKQSFFETQKSRGSVQGVKSLGGHFACLCRGFDFYEVEKNIINIFQKEKRNTFTLHFYSEKSSKRAK